MVGHRPFTTRNEYALTLVILRRDVGRGDSNRWPFEQVGGDQVALECLGEATNDICGKFLIVLVVGS